MTLMHYFFLKIKVSMKRMIYPLSKWKPKFVLLLNFFIIYNSYFLLYIIVMMMLTLNFLWFFFLYLILT